MCRIAILILLKILVLENQLIKSYPLIVEKINEENLLMEDNDFDYPMQADTAQKDDTITVPAHNNNTLTEMNFSPNNNNNNTNSSNHHHHHHLHHGNNSASSIRYEEIQKEREKSKSEWLDHIRSKVLQKTGRKNTTNTAGINGASGVIRLLPPEVLEQFQKSLNGTGNGYYNNNQQQINSDPNEGEYIEKIRSFYPSCEIPRNTDEDAWKDANTMNLYFNIEYNKNNGPDSEMQTQTNQEDVINIASATLRLYRIPSEQNVSLEENCSKIEKLDNNNNDDEKQIRVSVYWYSRSLKKHKAVKRRLADSRMVPVQERYIELNIRAATKSWIKGRNLGLGIVVEDIDGLVLPTEKHFKGITGCDTVGNFSTPKPIPTVVLDAIRDTANYNSNKFNKSSNNNNNNNGNVTTATNSNYAFMPKLDICTIQLPQNLSTQGQTTIDTSAILCRLLKTNNDADSIGRRIINHRHIRHQQHHSSSSSAIDAADLRSKFVTKRLVLTNTQLQDLSKQLKLTQSQPTNINR